MKMEWTVKTTGEYPIEAAVRVLGDDLLIAVWGGTHPHIGAIGIAHPRPSLKDPKAISATVSVYTVLGHKEDTVVQMMATKITAALNRMVVVTAGIHWDDLKPEDISKIIASCEELTQTIIKETKEKIPAKTKKVLKHEG
jgi:predicted nucleotidyltransferase